MFKMPTIDLSAKSLLMLSQLGFFVCFTYWFSQGADSNSDYLFPALFAISGLALFLFSPKREDGSNLRSSSVYDRNGIGYG
jgi:accessory gene regulator protein AgrB